MWCIWDRPSKLYMATAYAYLVLMSATLQLSSVNSVNSTHSMYLSASAMTRLNTLNIAVSHRLIIYLFIQNTYQTYVNSSTANSIYSNEQDYWAYRPNIVHRLRVKNLHSVVTSRSILRSGRMASRCCWDSVLMRNNWYLIQYITSRPSYERSTTFLPDYW